MEVNHFSKSDNVFGLTRQKQRRACQRSCCIIGLVHNYRIVEQSSPVHYGLRSKSNKKVIFAVHANRMKPFVDTALRPIEPPSNDDPSEPYLDESDNPADSFELSESNNHNSKQERYNCKITYRESQVFGP